MKVVITGGAGFIGTALCRRLVADGHHVRVIDALTEQVHGTNPKPQMADGVEFIHADVREIANRRELLDGFDGVVHLAAETGTAQSMYRIRHYVDVNEGGTAALLEAIAGCKQRPSRVVLSSSRSVYGEGAYIDTNGATLLPPPRTRQQLDLNRWELEAPDGSPLKPAATSETVGFAPGSIYAATKASQELLIESAASALGFSAAILRFQNVYGEGQSLQNPYTGIISIFFNRARQGLKLPIYEDGLETRDFVHVDDVVGAIMASLVRDVPKSVVCNIGAGVATTVSDLARRLIQAAGFDVPIEVTGQFRVGDIRHNWADISRAKILLGYEPKIDLADGLERFCSWAANEPIFVDRLDKATEELRQKGLAN